MHSSRIACGWYPWSQEHITIQRDYGKGKKTRNRMKLTFSNWPISLSLHSPPPPPLFFSSFFSPSSSSSTILFRIHCWHFILPYCMNEFISGQKTSAARLTIYYDASSSCFPLLMSIKTGLIYSVIRHVPCKLPTAQCLLDCKSCGLGRDSWTRQRFQKEELFLVFSSQHLCRLLGVRFVCVSAARTKLSVHVKGCMDIYH